MKLLTTLIALVLTSMIAHAQQVQEEPPGEVLACGTDSFGVLKICDGRLVDNPIENRMSQCTVTFDTQGTYYVRYKDGNYTLGKMAEDGHIHPVPNFPRKFIVNIVPRLAENDPSTIAYP
jgi:hypothetical protein